MATSANSSFGEYIRKLREENNLPIRKVAAILDVDPSTLSKIERGKRSANKDMLPILSELLPPNPPSKSSIIFLLGPLNPHTYASEREHTALISQNSRSNSHAQGLLQEL